MAVIALLQDARLRQVREAYGEYLTMMDGSACPLLDDLFDRMLGDFGWSDRAAEAGIQAEVIQHLGELDLWSKAGSRVTLNRFLQAVRVSAVEDKVWTARLHSQLYCCIQEDMLHGEAFRRHYERVPITVASGGEGKATFGIILCGRTADVGRAQRAHCRGDLVVFPALAMSVSPPSLLSCGPGTRSVDGWAHGLPESSYALARLGIRGCLSKVLARRYGVATRKCASPVDFLSRSLAEP